MIKRFFAPLGLLTLLLPAHAAFAESGPAVPAPAPAASPIARAGYDPPNGPRLLRALGPHAGRTFGAATGPIGALVALPPHTTAESLGLTPAAPGIGRLRGSSQRIVDFADSHPALRVEVAPALHPLMDRATFWTGSRAARALGADGGGVYVGIADTGIDITHPEMRDAAGQSRVAWLLDYSLKPVSLQRALWPHKALEEKFGLRNDSGELVAGAVFAKDDLDVLLAQKSRGPSDVVGHGTHVTGIAAASGIQTPYAGTAPRAGIVFVRVTRTESADIVNEDVGLATEFVFDRADADKKAAVVNISLGSDFGSHDGNMLWEKVIASHVGPDKPGHAIVAAAGNSGSIADSPIHQSVHVARGSTFRVPVHTEGAREDGQVQIWVTLRDGADLKIGLDGPDGEWIAPVAEGQQAGRNESGYRSGVIYGSRASVNSDIPEGSRGAVVIWSGKWPTGTYSVTFQGTGTAELYMQGVGEVGLGGSRPAFFTHGVREGTVNLPATNPAIIAVGCTVNRTSWVSIGRAEIALRVPLLDGPGAFPVDGARTLGEGEVCWFSSAGPTATGLQKPEISAPGGVVVSAMSGQAIPGTPQSIFTNPGCPDTPSGKEDLRCMQVDATHGISLGTSMASPMVAGVIALLFQRDPTLTQDQVRALLQGGAHRFRGAAPFADQAGPGEVDAVGSLIALERSRNPLNVLPVAERSWVALSADHVAADGSTPMTVLVELRTGTDGPADFFDLNRLEAVVLVDGQRAPSPPITRRGPGVFVFTYVPQPGLGGRGATFGATFDGKAVTPYRTIPIATDGWTASYAPAARGGCAHAQAESTSYGAPVMMLAFFGLAAVARRRRAAR